MEEVARFDAQTRNDYPGNPAEATLTQIRRAHARFQGFGKTGEFTLARRERILTVEVVLGAPSTQTWDLEVLPDQTDEQKAHLKAWLGDE